MDPTSLLLMVGLLVVFYFLLIRPQQKQRRQLMELQQSIKPGSRVMTGAGLLGTVVSIEEDKDEVVLEVAPGVTNTYVRRAIVTVVDTPGESDSETATDTDAVDSTDAPTTSTTGSTSTTDATDATKPRQDVTNGDDVR